MLALIYKDFILMRRWIALLLVIVLGLGLFLNFQAQFSIRMIPMMGLLINFIMTPMSLGFDEKGRFRLFALTSPASSLDYVLSKYAISWLVGLVTLAVTLVFGRLVYDIAWGEIFFRAVFALSAPLLVSLIMLPPLLFLGEEKGRVVIVGLYIVIFMAMAFSREYLAPMMEKMAQLSGYPWLQGGLFLGLVVIFHILSIGLSHHLLKRRTD